MVDLTDLPSERALLSACLWDAAAFAQAAAIEPDDFSSLDHQRIWRAMRALMESDRRFDAISVVGWIKSKGWALAPDAMTSLDGGTPAMAGVYATRIADQSRARSLVMSLRASIGTLEGGAPVSDVVGDVQRSISAACQTRDSAMVPMADVAPRVYNEAMRRADGGEQRLGYRTGLRCLDASIHGLMAPDLVVLAARPAMGKSALASQMALSVAQQGQGVIIFSLEMGRTQIVQRMLAQMSGVPLTCIRTGNLVEKDRVDLSDATGRLTDLPIYVDDRSRSAAQIQLAVQRRALVSSPALVIVDYLQLMSGSRRAGNREQEIAQISRMLKGIAMEHSCCVLALSQLNRSVEARANKRPLMADLRESGAIEQDADIILFVYRDAVYSMQSDDEHLAEIIIAKHRAGESGRKKDCEWNGPLVRFEDAMGVR